MTKIENPYASKDFAPYVIAIGQLALAWNDLQESLAGLFLMLMGAPPVEGAPTTLAAIRAWSSLKSDRSQRDMLRAVAQEPPRVWAERRPKIAEDVIWLVDRVQELEVLRNDAIHSPLFEASGPLMILWDEKEPIRPNPYFLNPRAISLSKRKHILSEFQYCRDRAISLRIYAVSLDHALTNWQTVTWPKRPILPNRPNHNNPRRVKTL